jgi:exopolyphosphatase / guanosine-5'-triphosphate,3'-diphosphate pyrophosphatase
MPTAELAGYAPGTGEASRGDRAAADRVATYAALDLGTNNCRLLVARPVQRGFRVLDSFSRIVRLGEGMMASGRLSDAAIARTLEALDICRAKMDSRSVTRARLIATEACRTASNGPDFIARVRETLGLQLEIVDRETEARLAAIGCSSLADPSAKAALLFDIGGGSSEVVWLAGADDTSAEDTAGERERSRVRAWVSLPLGVVTLAESFGGIDVDDQTYEAMVRRVSDALEPFFGFVADEARCEKFHLLGTSGTVTTIAGVHLNLPRYDRRQVDGLTMTAEETAEAVRRLRAMSYDERAAHGCIGVGRADLVLAGCAILEAISRAFPAQTLRIADRGLREGILIELMQADGVWRPRRVGAAVA